MKSPELSTAEIDRITQRVLHKIMDDLVVPFAVLQYATGEVAPHRVRVDPRMLAAVLRQISRRAESERGRHALFEPLRSIYVDPAIAKTSAWHKALVAARTKADRLADLGSALEFRRTRELAVAVSEELGLSDVEIVTCPPREPSIPMAEEWPSQDVVIKGTSEAGSQLRLLVMNDVRWLYPDDSRIWKHLAVSVEQKETPLIIARKAHLGVFPVMKRVGGLANELHHLYVLNDRIAVEHSRALKGWPPVRNVDQAYSHAGLQKVKDLLRNGHLIPPGGPSLIESAVDIGLADRGSPQRLLEWVRSNKLRMHGRWVYQVRRWNHWAG